MDESCNYVYKPPNIPSYVFPVTEEYRQFLLGSQAFVHTLKPFKICNSEVIFRYILLVPDFHHPRLAIAFCYILLSSSAFFTFLIICSNPKIRQGFLPFLIGFSPYFSYIFYFLSSTAYKQHDQTEDQNHQCYASSGDHIFFCT